MKWVLPLGLFPTNRHPHRPWGPSLHSLLLYAPGADQPLFLSHPWAPCCLVASPIAQASSCTSTLMVVPAALPEPLPHSRMLCVTPGLGLFSSPSRRQKARPSCMGYAFPDPSWCSDISGSFFTPFLPWAFLSHKISVLISWLLSPSLLIYCLVPSPFCLGKDAAFPSYHLSPVSWLGGTNTGSAGSVF